MSTFAAIVLSLPITIALAVAFMPIGNMAFGSWFGLGSQAQLEARGAVGLLIVRRWRTPLAKDVAHFGTA